jgi:transposase-like protein
LAKLFVDTLSKNKYNKETVTIAVVNALSGTIPLLLREKFPKAKIVCVENFDAFNDHLNRLGFETIKWDNIEQYLKENNMKKFDAIVGNPPYQKENSKAKRWTLWEEFVKKSKSLADTVIMVTPQSITSPGTFNLIKDNATLINIDVSKYFDVGSTFCYWMIDTTKTSTVTKIVTDSNEYELDLSKIDFLPSVITDETLALINTLTSRTPRTWKRGELHTSNTNLFDIAGKYSVMHTNAQTLKSNTEHPNRKKIRVAVTLSGYPTFQVITNGYASQACFWTECTSIQDAQKLADECNGEEIQKILEVFKWSGWNSKEVIKCL